MHLCRPRSGAGPQVSLVLPAYNPGALVESTWREIELFRHNAIEDWEFIFVCDGCTDGTAEQLRTLAQDAGPRVRVLSYPKNRGKGYAVRLGLEEARGRWRLFTDMDLAYGFDDITRVAQTLQNGADVAIASRDHPDSRLLLPPDMLGYLYRRRLQSMVWAKLVHWILPITVCDTQAGLKGLSARAANILLPRLTTRGFEFDCELLTACARLDLEVTEVPVTVRHENTLSTTTLRDIPRMLRKLRSIRRAWRETPAPGPLAAMELLELDAA
ncbi:MAG TPA: glycosyltransferase [Gemmataceae bacterium]|nr:glycosyltransferase [Gemmataceae bacterium]